MNNILIDSLKNIGPKKSLLLKNETGIETIEDLLYYKPRKYLDRSELKKIADLKINDEVTVSGIITKVQITGGRRRFLEVEISDESGSLYGVFFGGAEFLKKRFVIDETVLFSGKIQFYKKKQIVHPDFDFIDDESNLKSINTGRIIPLYRSSEQLKKSGFDSRGFRRIIKSAIDNYLDQIPDYIEIKILTKLNLISLREALFSIHFPESFEIAERARKRLAFNEIFFMQLYIYFSKLSIRQNYKSNSSYNDSDLNSFLTSLPFQLTEDQCRSIEFIKNEILAPYPMNVLLQGDVGSGKTIVSFAAIFFNYSAGYQAALMAPTEVLAKQHLSTANNFFKDRLRIDILLGSHTVKEKKTVYEKLESGQIDLIIGTHSLIQDSVNFKNLKLIVIDEQQRFGVAQRAALRKKGPDTDLLVMTATPIPRSLAMTIYGDLDVTSIMEKPANRIPIKTLSFPMERIKGVYNSIKKYIEQGRQIYYVLPLIEESEKLDLNSAKKVYDNLKNSVFVNCVVEILHGKMKQIEKDSVMDRFNSGEIDILVSTTIIEVGIDVPNASVMVIEHSERFGLSQLHQLRGRVGRGEFQSFCILLYPEDISEVSEKRIKLMVKIDDGFKISEEDLKLRGSGELIGLKQHGQNSGFEFTDLSTDIALIIEARNEAIAYSDNIENLDEKITALSKKELSATEGIRTKRILEILS